MQKSSKTKLIIFSILPVVLLLVSAEVAVRLLSLDQPAIFAGTPSVGPNSHIKADLELGWSLRPDNSSTDKGMTMTTNSLGLRSPEVHPKQPGEFRILSLGESTTFGTAVTDKETYSALLEEFLNEKTDSNNVTVINAGVGAYSSFQSLKYLELRGLKLEPDLILFYHEINDYLPPTWRVVELNEISATKTDKELYDSEIHRLSRILSHFSGTYRYLSYSYAKSKIDKLRKENLTDSPTRTIGLPNYQFKPMIRNVQNDEPADIIKMHGIGLGRRVTDEERLENFERLAAISREDGIELIIIHPSYHESTPHECLLTRFCRDNDVEMFEAHPSLHPEGVPASDVFMDPFHPWAPGHRRLAEGLADFIVGSVFSKSSDGRQSVDIHPGPTQPTPPTP